MTADQLNSNLFGSAAITHNPLEQFVVLAKTAKGAACAELIKQALETQGVHVFGELLLMPNIIELENGPFTNCFRTLNLFAYGTYRQYIDNKDQIIELTPIMKKKLQHLTIVTMAIKNKCIPYSTLLAELDITNIRDLEDLIIEAIYADIIHGKLDQKSKHLEVDYAIGRDIRKEDISEIVQTLQDWCDSCSNVLSCIEEQIQFADAEKLKRIKHKEAIDSEIVNLKKALKTQANDSDEPMATAESREATSGHEVRKKVNKKSLKAAGKSWFKNFS